MQTNNIGNTEFIDPLISAGFELIPLHAPGTRGAGARSMGKVPMLSNWRERPALTSAAALDHMLGGGNLGVRIGRDLLVVDADPDNYDAGDDALKRLCADFAIPPGFTVYTGRRGFHYYLRLPPGADMPISAKLAGYAGIDFKSFGGQVVAPGSVHENGRQYIADPALDDPSNVPEAPRALVEALTTRRRGSTSEPHVSGSVLEAMVKRISLDLLVDYVDWLRVGMAIHAASGGERLDLWQAISTQDDSTQYMCERKWLGFDADREAGVRVGTILHLLRESGVALHTLPAPVAEEVAADFAEVVGEESAVPGEPSLLDQLNKDYCFVDEGGEIYMYRELYDDTLERKYWAKYTPTTFRLKHGDRLVEAPFGRGKVLPAGDAWLRWPGRRQYDGIAFKPEEPPGVLPSGALNLWQGFSIAPSRDGSWSLLHDLVCDALAGGSKEAAKYILDWMAYAVQKPHLPAEVALVFRGDKGTGKGTLGRAFFRLFGRHGMHITSPSLLAGRFNSHLRDLVALFADEAFWAGNKEGESILKGLITEPMIAYEGKGKDAVMGRNCIHIMMASNLDWVVPADSKSERRFAVFQVQPSHVVPQGAAEHHPTRRFYDELNKQLFFDGGLARLLLDLQERDLAGFHPMSSMPRTKALGEQKIRGISVAHEFVITHGVLNGDLGQLGGADEHGWLTISKDALRGRIADARRAHRYLTETPSDNEVYDYLESVCPGLRRKRLRQDGARVQVWVLPPLAACREGLARRLGVKREELSADEGVTDWCPPPDAEDEMRPA
jgi:hypothetical protein